MRRLVIGTAGHIDHGKSALVRALTGIEPDRLQEEQARGITIDLGFAHADIGDVQVAFVDVPGHERFVRNMLAGATGIDAVLLVVAADESVMPQTREHLDICRLLGVRAGVIALTKADVADASLREVSAIEVRELVAGSFLESAPIVEVSAKTGAGLDTLRDALASLARRVTPRATDGPVRLPIDRVFTLRGFGTVVTGTLISGQLQVEQTLVLLPAGRLTRVRGLHVHGAAVGQARAGQRVAVNVGDLQVEDISRGDALASPDSFLAVRRIDVRLDVLPSARPLRHGQRVRVHTGTSEVMGRLAVAHSIGQSDQRWPAAPSAIVPGGRAFVRIRLEAPVVVTRGDRFVVRSYSPMTTVGGGLVLDPWPPRGGIRAATARSRFDALNPGLEPGLQDPAADAADSRACVTFVSDCGRDGITLPALAARMGLARARATAVVDAELAAGTLVRAGDVLLARAVYEQLTTDLASLVDVHHREVADAGGLPREEARDRLHVAPRVFDAVVDELTGAGQLTGRERLARPGRRATFSEQERASMEAVEGMLLAQGLRPLDTDDVAARVGVSVAVVERALALLVRDRRVVRVGGLVFHRAALDGLIAEVRALKRDSPDARLDVAAFKTRYDLSRKFAIPLLEFLDRERVTRRVGDARIVL